MDQKETKRNLVMLCILMLLVGGGLVWIYYVFMDVSSIDVDCLIDYAEDENFTAIPYAEYVIHSDLDYVRDLYFQKYPKSRMLVRMAIITLFKRCEK